MMQNVLLAFCFNGIGIRVAAPSVSVIAIFINPLWGRPSLFINALRGNGAAARRTWRCSPIAGQHSEPNNGYSLQ